jgi:non-ribosomal peptide synthetase-like protein
MWTSFVWFSEALTAIYEMLLVPLLFNFLRGTPFIAWAFRALGTNIGRRTFIDTTDMTEFDLVTIGDGAVLSHQSSPQTHLFEDRVMKLGPVVIGAGAVIGALSILLPDTVVGDQCSIAPLSLVMKGEELPAGSLWTGSPAEPF